MRLQTSYLVYRASLASLASLIVGSLWVVGCVPSKGSPGADRLKDVVTDQHGFVSPTLDFSIHQPDFLDGNDFNTPEEMFFEEYADDPAVKLWIHYFNTRIRGDFAAFLERGMPYKSMIQRTLKQEKIPSFFYYLAMIESGFKTKAKSNMGAFGLWQFMPGTAKRYGLHIDRYVDERLDPVKATVAAGQYLNALNNVFHSWFLAMAAYNAGEARIMGAIMRSGSRDFWELVQKKAMPSQTREYVPKFIAAVLIGQNPMKYGFEIKTPTQDLDFAKARRVSVPAPVSLKSIAHTAHIPLDLLQRLNPQLLRGMTPPHPSRVYTLWVPHHADTSLLASLKPEVLPKTDPGGLTHYKVRHGERLADVAKKFGMSVKQLRRLNALRHSRIIVGQTLKVQLKKPS